jgi:hypothetical protein
MIRISQPRSSRHAAASHTSHTGSTRMVTLSEGSLCGKVAQSAGDLSTCSGGRSSYDTGYDTGLPPGLLPPRSAVRTDYSRRSTSTTKASRPTPNRHIQAAPLGDEGCRHLTARVRGTHRTGLLRNARSPIGTVRCHLDPRQPWCS